jgi:hypothetical protein
MKEPKVVFTHEAIRLAVGPQGKEVEIETEVPNGYIPTIIVTREKGKTLVIIGKEWGRSDLMLLKPEL